MQFISPLTLLIIPLIGCLVILIFPYKSEIILPVSSYATSNSEANTGAVSTPNNGEAKNFILTWTLGNKQNSNLKKIALITSLINLIVSFVMWIQFDSSYLGYQFVTGVSLSENISFLDINLGVDAISICFVLLTTFITPIALLSSHKDIDKNLKLYLVLILLLETLQIAVFVVIDLLLFYVFFESVLIPLFLIIGIWGASEAKVRAAFLLFLYTLFGSLFMLLSILQIYSHLGSTDFNLLSVTEISLDAQKLLWLGFFLAFAIKTPLWPFTGWLFRAHVEAPLSGSVILAAVILKLATYAYLRILLGFLPDATQFFNPLVQGICIVTLVYASLAALRTHDSKALVALSSISHCAVIVLGLISNSVIGIEGGILVSLAHGFVSPALFICVGGIIYVRLHSRVIPYIRGLTTYMPVFSILFLIFILANSSVPLTMGWVGEQMSLIGIFEITPLIGVLGASSIFLVACYSVFMYNRMALGSPSKNSLPLKDISWTEFTSLATLLVPTILFGLFPDTILDILHFSVSDLIYGSNLLDSVILPVTMSSKLITDKIWDKSRVKNKQNWNFQKVHKISIHTYINKSTNINIVYNNIVLYMYIGVLTLFIYFAFYIFNNFFILGLKSLTLFSFVFFMLSDYLIRENYLNQSLKKSYFSFINLNYFSIALILATIALIILTLFSYINISLGAFDNYFSFLDPSLADNINWMSESDNNSNAGVNNNVKADTHVNINNPNITLNSPSGSIHIPAPAANHFAAAAGISGGAAIAIKVAQQVPGSPATKLVAGVATMVATQALTHASSLIIGASSNNNTQKFIESLENLNSSVVENISSNINYINDIGDKFSDFPLNLLLDINQLFTAEIMFLTVILNIWIAGYLTRLDYNKYLPDSKVGNFFKYFINRYINIWTKSVKYLLIYCWVFLFVLVISSKVLLFYVLYY